MDGFIITIMQFKFGNPQSLDFLGIGCAETFKIPFASGALSWKRLFTQGSV